MGYITVKGSAHRSFLFPAPRPLAYDFYSSLPRIVPFLPRIYLVQQAQESLCRVAYRSRELNTYDVEIFCDLQVEPDPHKKVLHIRHMTDNSPFPPIKTFANLTAAVAMGDFLIRSVFHDEGGQTRIDYSLSLGSTLPKPLGLVLMPTGVLVNVVERIVNYRIGEIVDAFVRDSVRKYREIHPPVPRRPAP